jgi:hypothetical protein
MILNVVQCNSQFLTHYSARKELVGEVSETCVRSFQRLYNDADYVGLALRNHKTGSVTRWYLADVVRNGDGAITEWQLYPTIETLENNPAVVGYTLRIIND